MLLFRKYFLRRRCRSIETGIGGRKQPNPDCFCLTAGVVGSLLVFLLQIRYYFIKKGKTLNF